MEVKTYRARSLQEALQLVRTELGPDAAVLHTREVREGLFRWLSGARRVEVTASNNVNIPSRFSHPQIASSPGDLVPSDRSLGDPEVPATHGLPAAHELDYRTKFREDLKDELSDLSSMVEQLSRETPVSDTDEMAQALFQLFTDLIDAEVSEDLSRELIERLRSGASSDDLDDPVLMKSRMARLIEETIDCGGPIRVTPGQRKLVALVGPTGVGKTTTIAKLAASFHLRERHRVGLITVDTYRIAAVDQLRTYADIIDLPMEVVSTPREMRTAVAKMADLDLILMDTAGRSPRDEVRIQELKSMLGEANADEVHLVLSSVTSASSMKKTAERFAEVGVTSLLLTKLDEATGLGNLLPVLRDCNLPLSYVTNGQNVPDDIAAAERRRLARIVLGMESIK
ncbi:MAG: flagellar biosynthesis protein FlhF [Pirellulaceae bacterium]|nr:flagellar biosynthesis protein FlhF [Pirellulaceae bacterium]MDP6557963.1 flagellar biosynthesis protein FlhF [Pirellulaceae bacterium]